jgi:hypothetical protein
MRLKYNVSRTVLTEGYRLNSSLRPAIIAGVTVFVVIAIVHLANGVVPKSASNFAFLTLFPFQAGFLVFVVYALVTYLTIPIQAWILHRQNPLLFGEKELVVDQDTVEIKGARGIARYHWSDFLGFKENEKMFLLCLSKSAGLPIPKQGLAPETVQQIREQWGQKLKRLR